jgi:hypothetical protein
MLSEFRLEHVADLLEYHPRRAVIYLSSTPVAFCFWIFSPSAIKFTATALVLPDVRSER